MDEQQESDEDRCTTLRPQRKAMLLAATLTDSRGVEHRARLRNVSDTGIGGVCDAPLTIGDRVFIQWLGQPSVAAEIVRVTGKEFGARLETSIATEAIRVTLNNEGSQFQIRDLHSNVSNVVRRPGLGKF